MKTLFGVAFLLLVGIVGVGFYQGWFHFSTSTTDHTSSATISVDQEKIHADEQKAKDKVQGFGKEAKEKIGDRTGKVESPERRP
jgi:predicted negative regulator of RcsB-dependent stress response